MHFANVHSPVGRRPAAPSRLRNPALSFRPDRFDRQDPPSFLGQFGARLRVRIEQGKVADDDRYRKCDGQHAGQRAQRSDEHPHVSLRGHVPVPHRCHGNDGPPEPDRDGREVVVGVVLDPLGVEDERGEDDDANDEEEDEQHELVGARLERVDEDLQAGRVARQFEQPHDADDAEELEHVVFLLEARHEEVQVEGEGGHKVDRVDRGAHEEQLVGADDEPHDQLEGEPGVADALDVEEGVVGLGPLLLQHPNKRRCRVVFTNTAVVVVVVVVVAVDGAGAAGAAAGGVGIDDGGCYGDGRVSDEWNAKVRMGFQAEREYGDDDEEDGHDGDDLENTNDNNENNLLHAVYENIQYDIYIDEDIAPVYLQVLHSVCWGMYRIVNS